MTNNRYLFTGQLLNRRFNDTINEYIAYIAHSQYKVNSETAPNGYDIVDGMLDMINDRLSADISTDAFNKELLNFKKSNYGQTHSFGSFHFADFFSNITVWEVIGVLIGLVAGLIVAVKAIRKV